MKLFTLIILILVIFSKTGNLLSDINLFSVNNILLEKNDNSSNKQLANQAIKKGYDHLIEKILLKEDIPEFSKLNFSEIKDLVEYYNISKSLEDEKDKINFSVTFNKDKIHNLFYTKKILYSEISEKEFYILPILVRDSDVFIFSNNFFYQNWNETNKDKNLIEFILPLENIEIIQNINQSKDNLLDLNLELLFQEYINKNLAIIIVESNNSGDKKAYIKTKIQNKKISKSFTFKKENLDQKQFNNKVINEIKSEIINLVKSQYLIDIRTPSFLNIKLQLNKNNLAILNSRIKNINLIEDLFVQELNKDYVNIKIKYFGRLDNVINQLKNKNIDLLFANDQWSIKIL